MACWIIPHWWSIWCIVRKADFEILNKKVWNYLFRQFLLLFDVVAIIVTGILQINNIALLMVMRVLQGFVVGAFMAMVPMYINEVTPVELRGS
jgi:MFS family permease